SSDVCSSDLGFLDIRNLLCYVMQIRAFVFLSPERCGGQIGRVCFQYNMLQVNPLDHSIQTSLLEGHHPTDTQLKAQINSALCLLRITGETMKYAKKPVILQLIQQLKHLVKCFPTVDIDR